GRAAFLFLTGHRKSPDYLPFASRHHRRWEMVQNLHLFLGKLGTFLNPGSLRFPGGEAAGVDYSRPGDSGKLPRVGTARSGSGKEQHEVPRTSSPETGEEASLMRTPFLSLAAVGAACVGLPLMAPLGATPPASEP